MCSAELVANNLMNDMSGGNNPFYMKMTRGSVLVDAEIFDRDTKTVTMKDDPIFAIWSEFDNKTVPELAKLFVKENIIKPTKQMFESFNQVNRKAPARKSDLVFQRN